MSLKIITGDWIEELKKLEDGGAHCAVTSPPFDNLRTYGGMPEFHFEQGASELTRVICDGGVICWNVGDQVVDGSETLTAFRQALYFKDAMGLRVHDTMIYEKLNFSHPERCRYHQTFEYVFIFSKGAPRTFNPIMDKRNVTAGQVGNLGVNSFTLADGSKSQRPKKVTKEWGMRTNVWRGKTRGQEDMCESLPHPAMMPKWLVRDLILSWSNPGDTIIDPFMGSGTTTHVALELGRNCVGIELNPEYVELARTRCNVTPGLQLV